MSTHNFPALYCGDHSLAKHRRELAAWKASQQANIACRKAIEKALHPHPDCSTLTPSILGEVLETFGFKRTGHVLAVSALICGDQEDISQSSKSWARSVGVYPDYKDGKNQNAHFAVSCRANLLEGIISAFNEAYQSFGMFDRSKCVPGTSELDFDGKALVLSSDMLQESCWSLQNQLWLATGGFGCKPHSSGRTVFATNLSSGEQSRFYRQDFIGVAQEQLLPDWAQNSLIQLRGQNREPSLGSMEMK